MSFIHPRPLHPSATQERAHQHADDANPFLAELPAATRTVTRCTVCGFTEVFTDEVVDRGWVLLAECPRCDHRWTESGAAPLAVSAPAPRATPAPAQIPARTRRRAPAAA